MKIQYTVVKCTLNQGNVNWTDRFCVMQKKTTNKRLLQNKFKFLDYSSIFFFFFFYLSRLDKHGSSYRG